jgi:hypothetical protein
LFAQAASTYESDQAHSLFDVVLKQHVRDGNVNYTAIKQDEHFFQYLTQLEQANPESLQTDKEQLAFWINAYNALSIKGVLDGLSPGSLFGRYKFFISTKHTVAGKEISLDDIEKKIIIPYGDTRIHFAIVCASKSCPKLISEAYTAEKLDEQMHANAIDFLNDTEKNRIDTDKKRLKLSKIFDWFREDFEKESGSLTQYVARYIQDEELMEKLKREPFKVSFLKYNWNLNGTFER